MAKAIVSAGGRAARWDDPAVAEGVVRRATAARIKAIVPGRIGLPPRQGREP